MESKFLNYKGLQSKWPAAADLSGAESPFRFEGEVGDLIVFGDIPPQIDGTFYRISLDRFTAKEHSVPIDGDGSISAFRIQGGRVDFKVKYVETERYNLERRAKKALFGLYKNPWTHHPCVRAAVDSTASTNVINWANRLLVLEEAANPYEVHPDTLKTLRYDPFSDQVKAKSFTAHPKVDPITQELVVFGYEAKGPASKDIITYSLDNMGKKTEELWVEAPFCTMAHDCGITDNWLVLMLWPFEASIDRMKSGGHHWAYRYDRPSCFIVVPRRKTPVGGWKEGEYRIYNWNNCMNIHTAGSWEEKDGKIYLEATRVHDNIFGFFPSEDGREPEREIKADFVRWEIDPSQPSESQLPDPKVVFDVPSEFPRIDDRFMGKKYKIVFMNIFMNERSDGSVNIFQGLNGLAMINHETGGVSYYYAGDDCFAQEPTFIPRSDDAEEGDGWVISLIENRIEQTCELVFLDTREFSNPIAIAKLPFRIRSQIHGNWVDARSLGTRESLVAVPDEIEISGKGALEPI